MTATSRAEATAWVPAKDVIRKSRPFLDRVAATEMHLKNMQSEIPDERGYGLQAAKAGSWLWRLRDDVKAIHDLAEMSIDGRILISLSEVGLLNRASPQLVDNAIGDIKRAIEWHERRQESLRKLDQATLPPTERFAGRIIATMIIAAAAIAILAGALLS